MIHEADGLDETGVQRCVRCGVILLQLQALRLKGVGELTDVLRWTGES
jgi:hypothetical protein